VQHSKQFRELRETFRSIRFSL